MFIGNPFICSYGNVRITDFGLISADPNGSREERAAFVPDCVPGENPFAVKTKVVPPMRTMKGGKTKNTWLAPEYVDLNKQSAAGIVANPNSYSDIWSCGAICLMIHGLFPIDEDFADEQKKSTEENTTPHWQQLLSGDWAVVTSETMKDFYTKVFKLKYRSVTGGTDTEESARRDPVTREWVGECRPSARELLDSDPWLNEEIADDHTFATFIVKYNIDQVEKCLKSCPTSYKLLARQPDGTANTFFAVLVGEYYKRKFKDKLSEQPVSTFLRTMGFAQIADKLEEIVSIAEIPNLSTEDLKEEEKQFIAHALRNMGVNIPWETTAVATTVASTELTSDDKDM